MVKWLSIAGLLGVIFLLAGFTFQDSTGTPGLLKGIGFGMLMGALTAFLGYAKDTDPNKKWDFKSAGATLLVGAIVGGIAGWEKKDISSVSDWVQSSGLVAIAELAWKALWRNTAGPALGGVLGYLKKDSSNPPK